MKEGKEYGVAGSGFGEYRIFITKIRIDGVMGFCTVQSHFPWRGSKYKVFPRVGDEVFARFGVCKFTP